MELGSTSVLPSDAQHLGRAWHAHSRESQTLLLKKRTASTGPVFFPKILLGENYKTFTVQCLQSQFVVNWFPKIYYNSSWLLLLHSNTYFRESSPRVRAWCSSHLYLHTLERPPIHPLSTKARETSLPFCTEKNRIVQVLEFSVIKQGIFMY